MTEIDNKTPEVPKAKPTSDDGAVHTLSVFAQTLAYTGIESPTRGVAQLIDHTLGTKLDDTVQQKFANAGVQKPEDSAYGTHAWAAQQFASAFGMTASMYLARKLMVGKVEHEIIGVTKLEGGFAAQLNKERLLDKTLREFHQSAKTGFFYGAVLTPTDGQNSSGNFVVDKLMQGAKTAATFGVMGASSTLTGEMLGKVSSALESTVIPSVFKSPLKNAFESSIVHGTIAGIPGGAIQAQLNAMEHGKLLASMPDVKESVISMTMVGGVMGGAGLFKEPSAKSFNFSIFDFKGGGKANSVVDNIEALRADSFKFRGPRQRMVLAHEAFEPHHLDFKYEPVDKAWPQAEVDRHKTSESRFIQLAAADRETKAINADWNQFASWALEHRDVPVDVYRFPGVSAEIIVPSDYARVLDRVREQRLDPLSAKDSAPDPNIDKAASARQSRILPEEIAQVIKQLPQPDLVKVVHLLDHANPNDMLADHERAVAREKNGLNPKSGDRHVSFADGALDGSGGIRIYRSSTNAPEAMHFIAAHEWAHLAQINPEFMAFYLAANVEAKGFYARPYATENINENWAVHLGERFVGPSGGAFAELPDKAPVRTLVMAKALRNMLEERSDNPSPRHAEFLARVVEAENIATTHMQIAMLADIVGGNHAGLDQKLGVIDAAVVASRSPEIFQRVLGPIEGDLMPVLEARDASDPTANSILAHRFVNQSAENYTPEQMESFLSQWKKFDNVSAQAYLFNRLPEVGQRQLLFDLTQSPAGYERGSFATLAMYTDGETQQMVKDAFDAAETKFLREGLELYRSNSSVPAQYTNWLRFSPDAEARIAVLQSDTMQAIPEYFQHARSGLSQDALRDFLAEDALTYVHPNFRISAWTDALADLSQGEQVKLFKDMASAHGTAFGDLAIRVENMNGTEFNSMSDEIRDLSWKIYERHLNSPESIMAHPRSIKDSELFLDAAKFLDNHQIANLISKGALDTTTSSDIDDVVNAMTSRLKPSEQLGVIAAIKPHMDSRARIEALLELEKSNDAIISSQAEHLLTDVADAQLSSLKARGETDLEAFLSHRALTRKMLDFSTARARIAYLKATEPDEHFNLDPDKFSFATFGLPKEQLEQFRDSEIIDRLSPEYRALFLKDLASRHALSSSSRDSSPEVSLSGSSRDNVSDPQYAYKSSQLARGFDIAIGHIDKAWAPDEVNKYRTNESRKIEFAAEGRENRVGVENWKRFHKWGLEERDVPVDVYRFPGVKAEIVVPSDYARALDRERERRLSTAESDVYQPNMNFAANDNHLPYERRILPEEIAQMLKQLPNPDQVRTIELLDHDNPSDMLTTHNARVKAERAGKTPESDYTFTALASADITGSGLIKLYKSATNEPRHMQWLASHEWSHVVQGDVAFNAFSSAAKAERSGFYSRDYARTSMHENWAVHLGERYLSPSGADFAELIENAPARAMVMAKAVRNMLEARKDNHSSKFDQLLARTQAAEVLAAQHLQLNILSDLAKGRTKSLENKLRFLNVAASTAQSPEFFDRVLGPIEEHIVPYLERAPENDVVANEVLANSLGSKLSQDYSPEKMPEFIDRWLHLKSNEAQSRLFKNLPPAGQTMLSDVLGLK